MQLSKKEFMRLGAAGHGRALLALQRARETSEPLPDWVLPTALRLCTRNHTYDLQCEPQREPYLVKMLELLPTDLRKQAMSQIYQKLAVSSPDRGYDYPQLLLLSALLANLGFQHAKRAVLVTWQKRAIKGDFRGGDAVIIATGANGYRTVLATVTEALANGGTLEDWMLSNWYNTAEMVVGTATADKIYEMARKRCLAFPSREAMADEVSRRLPPNPLVRAPFTQYVTVLKESTQAYKKLKPNLLTRPVFVLDIPLRPSQWGKFAKAGELAAAAEALVRERDPVMVVSLSRIFDMRKFPLDPAPLVRHLNSKHNAVVFATYRLLEKLKTPVVREAGLKHFNHNEWGHRATDLLVTNYRVGDLNLHYERLLELRRNPEDIHSYGMSAEKAAGRFLEKDMKSPAAAEEKNVAKKLLTLLYEELPCSMCREYVFKRMRSQRWVTKEMRAEWELDAVTLEERCPLI